MIAEVYKSIAKRLMTEVPGLRWVDLYRNQYKNPDKEYPFAFPAVFIEFVEMPFKNNGSNTSSATGTIKIHMVNDNTADTFTTDIGVDNIPGLIYLVTIDSIHKALQGFTPDYCSRLQGGVLNSDTEDSSMIVYLRDYSCELYDFSTGLEANLKSIPVTVVKEPTLNKLTD